jgi:hypothetical protein
MFIPSPGSEFFPSRIRIFSILDLHQLRDSVYKLSDISSGMFIPDPDPDFTHPGSRGQKGIGSQIRIRNTGSGSDYILDPEPGQVRN